VVAKCVPEPLDRRASGREPDAFGVAWWAIAFGNHFLYNAVK
jgi:hypothetical protein